MKRYRKDKPIKGGRLLATAGTISIIRRSVRNGSIHVKEYVTKESERLDTLAGRFLGDSRLWWVLAATSGIGWGLQIPPGTSINIPMNLAKIRAMV
tara:strand:- start:102 stop:389 length:288 start_codon:yes stop_codon:yes gene_type:complete